MSQRVWMKWMLTAVCSVLATGAAHATDATVAGDAYVNSAHPSTNYGGLSNLYVGNGGTALIQFDLSSLPAGTTASQIGKATLKLYVNRIATSGAVSVQPVTGAWSESTVTYATIPALGSAVSTFTPTASQQFVVVDITALVQGWVTTPAGNFGLALSSASGNMVFDSKENDETSHVAHLDITVVSQGPAGPQGIQGIQGATGATGAQGPQGVQGPTGLTGATGAQGPPVSFRNAWSGSTAYAIGDAVSESGASYIALTANTAVDPATDVSGSGGHWAVLAAKGATGATGSQGVQGNQGIQGIQGLTGLTGATGATGAQGPPVSFRNAWSGSTAYAIGDAVSESGSSYIALTANTAVDPATDVSGSGGHWAVLAEQGATGSQGVQGNQGIQGIQGATGLTGATGAMGAQGPPVSFRNAWSGSTAYAIGDAVSESGSSYIALTANTAVDPATDVSGSGGHWAVLAAKGTTGTAATVSVGTTTTGAAGTSASVTNTGSSGAAVFNFTIPQGATGAQGPQGAQGPAGATGAAGTNGSNGSQGPQGAQGPAGPTGPTGPTGPEGTASVYGDGSDGTTSGVCDIASNINWVTSPPSTDIQCTNFTVVSGVTLTVPTGTVIHATGTVTIYGTITVQAGAAQGLYQAATDLANEGGGIALPRFSQRKTLNPGPFGGGNGGGSNLSLGLYGLGGGSLVILAEGSLTIEPGGAITANGTNGGQETSSGFSDGGGAGGIIILASKTSVANDGTLTADGGSGAAAIVSLTDAGGGGGGGIIHLLAPSGQITLGTTHILGGSVGGGNTNSNGSGFGGGACGGNGGNGSNIVNITSQSGSNGNVFTTAVADPSTLFVP